MNEIKNILICGLGAIGGYYATKIFESGYNLKILVDGNRLKKYKTTPRIINGKEYDFDYVLPEGKNYTADLIIIATKSDGLDRAIKNISDFIGDKTIILSFLNGVKSEEKIIEKYGDKVLYSYLLGHTFFRKGNSITHDGLATIHYGSKKENDSRVSIIKDFFEKINAAYKIEDDIITSLWKKFCFNCCANQISAITRMTFGEMLNSEKCLELIKNICAEISQIAEREGIKGLDFYRTVLDEYRLMIPDGKTSMLQDVESGKKPEVDIFGETVVEMGKTHGIDTPYNKVISEILGTLNFS